MIQALIGKKIDQSQTFLENGQRIPVTEVAVSENIIVQVKTKDTDTYAAIQLGYGTKKKPTKALLGHAKKAKLEEVPSIMKEVAWIGDDELPTVGDVIAVGSVFKPGDIIQVTGTSKGKGFAGTVKRYNFRGGPKTHGQSDRHRAPGSIGQGTTPGRVYKGKRMAGHMGVDTVTVRNLTVVDVDEANNKLYVLGLVPGHKQATVLITRMGEQKNFVRLLSVKQKEDVVAAEEAARVEKEQAEAAKEAEKTAAKEAAKEANTSEAEATKEEVKAEAPQEEKQEAEAPATEETKDEDKAEEKEKKVEN